MVVKVEMCVACHMTEREGAGGGREGERERVGEKERDREMEKEKIIIGKRKWDGITHILLLPK